VKHFCVKFGDLSCIGFEISCGKTARQTDKQTNKQTQTPLKTLATRLPSAPVISVTLDNISKIFLRQASFLMDGAGWALFLQFLIWAILLCVAVLPSGTQRLEPACRRFPRSRISILRLWQSWDSCGLSLHVACWSAVPSTSHCHVGHRP